MTLVRTLTPYKIGGWSAHRLVPEESHPFQVPQGQARGVHVFARYSVPGNRRHHLHSWIVSRTPMSKIAKLHLA